MQLVVGNAVVEGLELEGFAVDRQRSSYLWGKEED
jgi:hypothetical protein